MFSLSPFQMVLTVIGLLLTLYIGYRASINDRSIFSVSLIALFGGLLFESFRVSDHWKTVIYTFARAYFFSLICFIPGKRERIYVFENHIEIWPYFFIISYAITFAIIHKDKVTAKLTEGTTLLLSLSLIYWIFDYGFTNYDNWLAYALLAIAGLLSTFSFVNGLTNLHLSRITRLILSLWSTVIMFVFAVDNIIQVFDNPDIESTYLSDGLYIGIQFFLLGVSAVYIMQNYLLLLAFHPTKMIKSQRDLQEAKKEHIDRFSSKQILVKHALLCILFASTLFYLNYTYHVLPRHTMIWFVFLTFPMFLRLIDLNTHAYK